MKNIFCVIAPLLCAVSVEAADPLRRKGEETIFAFSLRDSDKYVSVSESLSEDNSYIVYRFGRKGAVELEFPERKNKKSWDQFEYRWHLRGGPENEGLDLNYLVFENGGWRYIVYDEYSAVGDEQRIGVRMIRLDDCKMIDFPGKLKSKQGSLIDLRLRYQQEMPSEERCEGMGRDALLPGDVHRLTAAVSEHPLPPLRFLVK